MIIAGKEVEQIIVTINDEVIAVVADDVVIEKQEVQVIVD